MDVQEFHELPGVRSIYLNVLPDERGFFLESWRTDWQGLTGGEQIVQANTSLSYPQVIRAWHRHLRGQVDYFLVLQGALKICAYDDRAESPETRGKLVEIIASAQKPQLVRIPGIYWHGFKNIHHEPSLLTYYVNKLYDYQNPDEERRNWNDPGIVDPRNGRPFDWNAPPYR
jgi:dTDP-4-dehydrorhamnose 3,5-epimerase